MNVKQTLAAIRALGLTARYRDGEWRVNYPGGLEATANYTNDNDDALGTARAMVRSDNAATAWLDAYFGIDRSRM